jgi:tetratricopeptide (TPR) repeat protein
MKLLKHYIVFCLLLLAVPMVGQQWYFTVDEYRDAERDVLRDVRRVMVVNNALVQPETFGHSTALDGSTKSGIAINLERGLLYTMFAVTQTLDASGEMDAVELLDVSQNNSHNYYSRQLLSNAAARVLLENYDMDALLVLNQLVIYDVLESFEVEEGGQYAYLQAFAQSHWSVYYKDASRRVESFTQADTLVWESDVKYNRTQALNMLPDRQEALLYLASVLGDNIGASLLPSWELVRRYMYSDDNAYVQKGLEAFRYQRWQEAIGYWQLVIGSGVQEFRGLGDESNVESRKLKVKEDKKAAAVATANMAIAYELLGDYDSACASANEACRLFGALKSAWARQQQVNIRYYLEQLRAKKAREGAR